MENNEINITDTELKKVINNKKINARILSLIEIVDNMILNQFFSFYSKYIKKEKIEVFESDKEKEKEFKEKLKQVQKLSYIFYLKNRNHNIEIKELYIAEIKKASKKEKKSNIKIKELGKIEITDEERKIKEDYKKIANNEIRYPFDVFGTNFFMIFLKTIFSQIANKDEIFLKEYIKKNLIIDFESDIDFLKAIYRIYQLRQMLEHKTTKSKKTEIQFYCNKLPKKKGNLTVFPLDFSLEQSLKSLFLFLPIQILNETQNYIFSQIKNEIQCPYCKKIFETKKTKSLHYCPTLKYQQELSIEDENAIIIDKECKIKLREILNRASKNAKERIKECVDDNNKVFARQVSDLDKMREKTKFYCKPSLFHFIKMYNFIGEKNIAHIRTILKTMIAKHRENTYCDKISNFQNIRFEEIYKVFMLLININEIFRINFTNIFEDLKNYIKNLDKYKSLEEKIRNLKNEIEKNDKQLSKNRDQEVIKNQRQLKQEKKKTIHKYNKMNIKNKYVELVRNNIAHSNLFFYDVVAKNKNEEIKYTTSYNIDDTFNIYLSNILNFYNNSHNKNNFIKIVNSKNNTENDLLDKENTKKSKNTPNIDEYKRLLIKQLSQLLLKKDYLFLLIPEEVKSKNDNKIKYEMQKLSISMAEQDIKQAFNKIIEDKKQSIIDNTEKHILANNIDNIKVVKYKYYYFLKNILLVELNKVKKADLESKNKQN